MVVLAAITAACSRSTGHDPHAFEVHTFFGELRIKQEQFMVENAAYLSLSANEGDSCCGATERVRGSLSNAPAAYAKLRFEPELAQLECNYVVIAGKAGDNTGIGRVGSAIMPDSPASDWWYGIAHCPSDDRTYLTKHDVDKVIRY
jgi:hypothetical protein